MPLRFIVSILGRSVGSFIAKKHAHKRRSQSTRQTEDRSQHAWGQMKAATGYLSMRIDQQGCAPILQRPPERPRLLERLANAKVPCSAAATPNSLPLCLVYCLRMRTMTASAPAWSLQGLSRCGMNVYARMMAFDESCAWLQMHGRMLYKHVPCSPCVCPSTVRIQAHSAVGGQLRVQLATTV